MASGRGCIFQDDFQKAALNALKARKKGKLPQTPATVLKKPRMAGRPAKDGRSSAVKAAAMKHGKHAKAEKKEKIKKQEKPAKVEIGEKDIMGAMPKLPKDGTSPPAIYCNGGVIYTSIPKRTFRTLTTRGDNYSEKKSSWGGDKPTKDAWAKAVKLIDKARNDEK